MLIESHRKRRRGGGAFTVADLPRPPRRTAPLTTPVGPVHSEPPAVRPRVLDFDAAEEKQEESEARPTTTVPTETTTRPRLVDRRVLLSRASRMQLMLLERLRCVNLRRARRAELLDEITRLKKVMEALQRDIDATTRNLEQLEQLVQRLQQISFDGILGPDVRRTDSLVLPTTTRLAPGTILWTNPAFRTSDRTTLPMPVVQDDARKPRASGAADSRVHSG